MPKEEFKKQEDAAPFNMALATLEALRGILNDIKKVYADPSLPDEIKQKTKVFLVKRFYVDSAPLLKETVVNKYKGLLNLKPIQINIVSDATGDYQDTQRKKLVYDEDFEMELDKHLIDLQIELQKEKYYMPPKKDKGMAVATF